MFKNLSILETERLVVNPTGPEGVGGISKHNYTSKSVKNMAVVRVNGPASYAG